MKVRRLIAFLLAASMIFGDVSPVLAAELLNSGGTIEKSVSGYVNKTEGENADAESGQESSDADAKTETDDTVSGSDTSGELSETPKTGKEDADTETGLSEEDNYAADEESGTPEDETEVPDEGIEVEPIPETEVLPETAEAAEKVTGAVPYLTAEYLSGKVGEGQWGSSFGAQLDGDETAMEIYQALVKAFVTDGYEQDTAVTEACAVLTEPLVFEAETADGTLIPESYAEAKEQLETAFESAWEALYQNYPQLYWIKTMSCEYEVTAVDADGQIAELNFTAETYDDNALGRLSEYRTAVQDVVDEAGSQKDRYEQVKYVHDLLRGRLAYSEAAEEFYARTSAIAFLGYEGTESPASSDGYAKAFQVLCGELGIPCVPVRGLANEVPHMWNYVQMEDGRWYLVDIARNDRDGTDTYFLAGENTQGIDNKSIGEDYIPQSIGGVDSALFAYPKLAESAYERLELTTAVEGIAIEALPAVKVIYNTQSKEYESFNSAVSDLKNAFNGGEGSYCFEFGSNAKMSGNITLPNFVTGLELKSSAKDGVDLDFNGYTLTTQAAVDVKEGLRLVSTSKNKGKLVLNGAAEKGFRFTASEGHEETETIVANNVDITVSKGAVTFPVWNGEEGTPASTTKEYTLNGIVTANDLNINYGKWKINSAVIAHDLTARKIQDSDGVSFVNLTMNGGTASFLADSSVSGTLTLTKSRLLIGKEEKVDPETEEVSVSTVQISMELGTIQVKSAYPQDTAAEDPRWTVENYGTLRAETLNMPYGTFYNGYAAYIDTASSIKDFDNTGFSMFVAGTYNQASSGKTYLEAHSSFVVKEKAVIYNAVIGGRDDSLDYGIEAESSALKENDVRFYQMPGAAVSFEGTVTRKFDNVSLLYAWLAEEIIDLTGCVSAEKEFAVQNLAPQTVLFTTKTAKFPVEYVKVRQKLEGTGFTEAYQLGQQIRVDGFSVEVRLQANDGTVPASTVKYKTLDDAVTGITKDFKSLKGVYTFTFLSDVKLTKNITLPACVEKLYLKSEKEVTYDERNNAHTRYLHAVLDLSGFTLTTSADVEMQEGIYLTSTVKNKGRLVLNGAADRGLYIDTLPADAAWKDAVGPDSGPANRGLLAENVDITVSKGLLQLNDENRKTVCILQGIVTASAMQIDSGMWKTDSATVNGLFVSEEAEVSFEALTAKNALMDILGKCTVSGATIMTASRLFVESGAETEFGTIQIKSAYSKDAAGEWTIENRGTLRAETLTMSVGAFDNGMDARIETVSSLRDFENEEGALFVCDTYNQTSAGKTYLQSGSEFAVNTKGTVYNLSLGGRYDSGEGIAYFYQMPEAAVSFGGKVTRMNEEMLLGYGVLAGDISCYKSNGHETAVQDIEPRSRIFTTKIASFPVEYLQIVQASDEYGKYFRAYQLGQEIRVGGEWITVYSQNDAETEEELRRFVRWSDAVAYLTTLANTSMTYVVEISEDLDIEQALTLSAKVKKLIIRGLPEDEDRITFTYAGDINLPADLEFENIELKATKNSAVYQSALVLNAKSLTLKNVKADLASVSGVKLSNLVMDNSKVTVSKTLTVAGLTLMKSSLTAVGAVSVTGTLTMEGGTLETENRLTIVNVVSCDDRNRLVYGGNKNPMTVSGTVAAPQGADGTAKEGTYREAAIDIGVKYLADNYKQDDVLLTASKAAASWFVVGSSYSDGSRTNVESTVHKDGTVIKYGAVHTTEAIRLSLAGEGDDSDIFLGGYATLQEAFTEIENLAVATASYIVTVKNSGNGTDVMKKTVNPTFPSKAAMVTVQGDGEVKELYYNNAVGLRCSLRFENLKLSPNAVNSSVSLGNFRLTLDNCELEEGKNITSVAGSGVAKDSVLDLSGGDTLVIEGAFNNVGELRLGDGSNLEVHGTVNVGKIVYGTSSALTGLAGVTHNTKDDTITKIAPQITINGGIIAEDPEKTSKLQICLKEKSGTEYHPVEFAKATFKDSGIQIAKAIYANPKDFTLVSGNAGTGTLTKQNGYLAWFDGSAAVELDYDGTEEAIPFRSFADAVTEINNLKTKREYVITLQEAAEEQTKNLPAALTMPNKNYISKLTIDGQSHRLSYLGSLTMTSDVVLKNVSFVQMVKAGASYITVKEQKNDYPALAGLSAGGFELTVDGNVTFNVPLKLDGGRQGAFCIAKGGSLVTETNGYSATVRPDKANEDASLIVGQMINFRLISLGADQALDIAQYSTNAGVSYIAASLTATDVEIASGGKLQVGVGKDVAVQGHAGGGSATVTNLNLSGGFLYVYGDKAGRAILTNVTLEGSTPQIWADRDLTVSGTLTSATDSAVFSTRQKTDKNKTPYLSVNGKIYLTAPGNRIEVCVYLNSVSEAAPAKLLHDEALTALKLQPQLLTARNGNVEMFRAAEGNVEDKELYSSEKRDGYMLVKTGNNIYVYDSSKVVAALYKNGELLNYYPGWAETVNAINAYNDIAAEYTISLIQDVGVQHNADGTDKIVPIVLTMPTKAKSVTVTSEDQGTEKKAAIYYSSAVTLRTDTLFGNIILNPATAKEVGASLDFSTGNYNLTLQDVSVGLADSGETFEGSVLRNISGGGKQTVTLDSDNLKLAGNISGVNELCVERNTEILGAVRPMTLRLADGVTLMADQAASTIVVTDIVNEGAGTLVYGRTARDVTNLTINGTITNMKPESPLVLNMIPADGKETAGYELVRTDFSQDGLKTVLNDANRLTIIAKAPTSAFVFQINGADAGTPVKANKGLYLDNDDELKARMVSIESEGETFDCLDLAQAVNEINNLSDKERNYTLIFGTECRDTNITDGSRFSAMVLPGNNKSKSLKLTGEADSESKITFTGHLTGYGELTLENLIFNPVNGNGVSVDFNISGYASSAPETSLTLNNVSTEANKTWTNGSAESNGFINLIQGTRNRTDVTLANSNLRLKTGITNVNNLKLESTADGGSSLITCKASTINDLSVNNYTWDTMGATVINNIIGFMGDSSYLSTKQTAAKLPQLTLNGTVSEGYTVVCRLISSAAPLTDVKYLTDDEYANAKLLKAQKESAEKFKVLYSGSTPEDAMTYKDTAHYVVSGRKAEMAVQITREGDRSATYAKCYQDAVTIINNLNDTTASYIIELLEPTDVQKKSAASRSDGLTEVKTGKDGTAYAALTFPGKAVHVTLKGGVDNLLIQYTGSLSIACPVTLENLTLTEGSVHGTVFTPTYQVTPVLGNMNLTFKDSVSTLAKPEDQNPTADEKANLVLASASALKGVLTLEGGTEGQTAYVKNAFTVPELRISENVALNSDKAVTLTNIGRAEEAESAELTLDAKFTASASSLTQLAINGMIEDVKVKIAPQLYNAAEKTYHKLAAGDVNTMNVTAAKPVNTQKLAALPKAAAKQIDVLYDDTSVNSSGYHLYKYEGALYLTNRAMGVRVEGYADEGMEESVWQSEFLDWDQAVKEIDRIADSTRYYKMTLLNNAGGTMVAELPLGTLSMPTRAAKAVITSAESGSYAFFFTGTTVTVRCNTVFENVGLFALKKVGTVYESTTYNINAGNFLLSQRKMTVVYSKSGENIYESLSGKISGAAKGIYEFHREDDNRYLASPAEQITGFGTASFYNDGYSAKEGGNRGLTVQVVKGMSGITDLNINPGVEIEALQGDVSTKNLWAESAGLRAKNITVTGETVLTGGELEAGTSTVGDGRIRLANVRVSSMENGLTAKQDANGSSMLEITGTVGAAPGTAGNGRITVGIRYNNSDSKYAQLYEGMTLLTAAKASASWFVPRYTPYDSYDGGTEGMGREPEADEEQGIRCGVFKNGKIIKYGRIDAMEVRLKLLSDGAGLAESESLFAAFEEAVTEINNLALYKIGTKVFADYEIELLQDVEIGNVNKDGRYSGLALPSRAEYLAINGGGHDLKFSGNLSAGCNVMLKDIGIYPMKTVSGAGVPTKGNIAVGNYCLTMDRVMMADEEGNSLIGNITGASAKGRLVLCGSDSAEPYEITADNLSGLNAVEIHENARLNIGVNYQAYQTEFGTPPPAGEGVGAGGSQTGGDGEAETAADAVLHVIGNLNMALLYSHYTDVDAGNAVIERETAGTVNIVGATVDLDGDKVKENVAVIRGGDFSMNYPKEDLPKIRIEMAADEWQPGTKVLTCKYLNKDDFSAAKDDSEYELYTDTTTLYVGTKAQQN